MRRHSPRASAPSSPRWSRNTASTISRRRSRVSPAGTRRTRTRRNGSISRGRPASAVHSRKSWRAEMGEHVIKLPDVGEGVAEAELVEWHVKVGDLVREDAVLAAVMTDKATVELPSPTDGEVLWLGAEIGETVAVGSPIARLKVAGEGNAAAKAAPVESKPVKAEISKPKKAPETRTEPAESQAAETIATAPMPAPVERPAPRLTVSGPARAAGERPLAAPA